MWEHKLEGLAKGCTAGGGEGARPMSGTHPPVRRIFRSEQLELLAMFLLQGAPRRQVWAVWQATLGDFSSPLPRPPFPGPTARPWRGMRARVPPPCRPSRPTCSTAFEANILQQTGPPRRRHGRRAHRTCTDHAQGAAQCGHPPALLKYISGCPWSQGAIHYQPRHGMKNCTRHMSSPPLHPANAVGQPAYDSLLDRMSRLQSRQV